MIQHFMTVLTEEEEEEEEVVEGVGLVEDPITI